MRKKFEKCLRVQGEDNTVREAAAYTATRTKRWAEAAKHWLKVSLTNARRPGPIQQYVSALIRAGEYDTAETFCRENAALQVAPQTVTRDSLLVRIYLAQGRPTDAQLVAETSYAEMQNPRLALDCARGFFGLQYYVAVGTWLDRIPADSKEAAQVPMMRARLHYMQKAWDKSESVFKQIAADGDVKQAAVANLFLARIAVKKGDGSLADARFSQVLAATPGHKEAVTHFVRAALQDSDAKAALRLLAEGGNNIGIVHRTQFKARATGMTDPAAARGVYADALEQHPENAFLRAGYAAFLLDMGDLDSSEGEIQTCLDLTPAGSEALRLRLRFLQMSGAGFEVQLEHAELMLEYDPTDAGLLNTVGGLLERCGRRSDAVRHYQAAVEAVPHSAQLWRNGTYHITMDNRLEEAAIFAQRGVTSLGTQTVEGLTNAAWIMQAAGLNGDALGYINQAIERDPASIKAQEMAVDLQMATGDYAQAWACIQQVDALYFPRRTPKVAHAAAQCMAAFRAVAVAAPVDRAAPVASLGALAPVSGQFPELLFDAIIATSEPDNDPTRSGIVHFTSNLGSGGAERQVAYVAQGLAENPVFDHPASIVVNSLDANTNNDFFLPLVQRTHLNVVDLDDQREAASIRHILTMRPDLAATVRVLSAMPSEISCMAIPFYAHLIEHRPQIVHLWQDAVNVAGGIAAAAAGVPQIVLCTRSTRPVEIRRYRRYLQAGYHALERYRGQVKVINNSANGARDYEDWLGWGAGRIGVFYNGYDFAALRARTLPKDRKHIRAQFKIPHDAKVVGGVMRFSVEKRPDLWVKTMIAAVGEDQDVHGLIVGDGPMRADLMTYVADAGLSKRIHFAGRQNPIEPWMRAMDVLFLSSVTEGLPNVLVEAQALGVPVATMNVGGAPEALAPDVSGIVLDEADPDVLADRILAALTDSDRMDAMGVAAVEAVAERFALSRMVTNLKATYGLP